jgi:hypothetical protein
MAKRSKPGPVPVRLEITPEQKQQLADIYRSFRKLYAKSRKKQPRGRG